MPETENSSKKEAVASLIRDLEACLQKLDDQQMHVAAIRVAEAIELLKSEST